MSTVIKFPKRTLSRCIEDTCEGRYARADLVMYAALHQGIAVGNTAMAQRLLDCLQGVGLGHSVVPVPDDLAGVLQDEGMFDVIVQIDREWRQWCADNGVE